MDKVMLLANTATADAWLRGRCNRTGPRWRAWLGMEQEKMEPSDSEQQQEPGSKPPRVDKV